MNKAFRDRFRASLAGFNRGLWILTGGQIVQIIGDHFLTIATSAYVYNMTHSAWAYALQQLAMFGPWMLFSSIAGHIVDRFDRRRVLIISDVIRASLVFCYPFCQTLETILLINFLRAIGGVFAMNARVALVPRLCDRERLLQANGIRTAAFGVIDLCGPTLAGFLMARIGTTVAFRFTAVMWIAGALIFLNIPAWAGVATAHQAGADAPKRSFGRELRQGLDFLRADKALLGMILLFFVYDAGQNGTNSVFYPYVETVLKGGPAVFGLSISFYFGARLVAGALLARFGKSLSRLPMVLLMVPGTLVWFGYSLARSVPLVLVMGFVEGTIFALLEQMYTTRLQASAPAEMTGRVYGLASTLTSGGEVFSILVSGAIAGRLGPVAAYRAIGAAGLSLVLTVDLIRRAADRRRRQTAAVTGQTASAE